MGKLIPSAALLGRNVRSWRFIEADIAIVGMSFHDAVFRPSDQGTFGDAEFGAGLRFCQHPPFAQPIIARAQTILFNKIDDPQISELRAGLTTPR